MKKKGIIALISSLVGIVVVGGAVGAALLWAPVGVNKPGAANTSNSTAPVKSNLSIGQRISENLLHINKTMNVLLIANNARNATSPLSLGTAAGQADIILIAHIDPTTHKITLISVPRDTLIAMPQYDIPIPKIKSAFNIGLNESPDMGPKLEIKAVSQLTGLPISYWIVTDFQGFIDAVNAVGGIQVNVQPVCTIPLTAALTSIQACKRLTERRHWHTCEFGRMQRETRIESMTFNVSRLRCKCSIYSRISC